MTKIENFKLVAKIHKQHAPGSADRAIASLAISIFQDQYRNNTNMLKLKLETLLEETA